MIATQHGQECRGLSRNFSVWGVISLYFIAWNWMKNSLCMHCHFMKHVTVLMLSVVYHICVRWQVWCFSCKVCVPVFIHSAFSDMCMFSIRMCTLRQRCLLNWHSSVFVIHVFVNKTNVCTCELIQTDFVFENSRWLQRQKLDKILHRNAKDSFMRMSKHWKNV